MQIFINQNGQNQGPYSLADIQQFLTAGQLNGTEMAWYEGAPGWMPLAQVPGITMPFVNYPSPQSPVTALSPEAPPPTPAYSAPPPSYGASPYGAPPQGYGAPPYGAPPQGYGPPPQGLWRAPAGLPTASSLRGKLPPGSNAAGLLAR